MKSGFLRSFLQPGILQRLPPGMVEDAAANFSLTALMRNANAACTESVAVSTGSGTAATLTAAQSIQGAAIMASGASGDYTLTLPSTASIIAALGKTIPVDGSFSKPVWIKNDGVGHTATLTAGDASTTVVGTATIATNTTRLFILNVVTSTTITYPNFGSMSL